MLKIEKKFNKYFSTRHKIILITDLLLLCKHIASLLTTSNALLKDHDKSQDTYHRKNILCKPSKLSSALRPWHMIITIIYCYWNYRTFRSDI